MFVLRYTKKNGVPYTIHDYIPGKPRPKRYANRVRVRSIDGVWREENWNSLGTYFLGVLEKHHGFGWPDED